MRRSTVQQLYVNVAVAQVLIGESRQMNNNTTAPASEPVSKAGTLAAECHADAARPVRLAWNFAYGIIFYHLVALLSLLPWFFSWTGVILAVLSLYVFGILGINIGYHRLLTHKGFACPKWLERIFVVLGVCCLHGSPIRWVAIHRRHHQHADEENDPHSPLVSFFWAHVGWVMVKMEGPEHSQLYERYSKDLMRDKFYAWIDSRWWWCKLVFMTWGVFFLGGAIAELLLGGTIAEAIAFGLSLLVWGVFVRTVIHWHATWAVNSVTHLWGYRNYDTPDNSRNNIILGLLANGEGWHNNHHADPRSARHGHKSWELDVTWLTIRFLMWIGLATNVALPAPQLATMFNSRSPSPDRYRADSPSE
jgi:sn-1 stearoyl-lipid 9-desaturase